MRTYRAREFLFEPSRFKNDPAVMGMSLAAIGAYAILFCEGWDMPEPGVFPDNDNALTTLARTDIESWLEVRSEVATAFDTTSRPGFWIQKGLVETHETQNSWFGNQIEYGRRGGAASGRARSRALTDPSSDPSTNPSSKPEPCVVGVVGVVGIDKEDSKASKATADGPSARCLARCKKRFPQLDIELIEAKLMAKHGINSYKNLDSAMLNWCKTAESRGLDAATVAPRMTPEEWARQEVSG